MIKTLFHSMKKKWVSLFLLMFISFSTIASDVSPVLNNGQKWRIAYYEAGPYIDYNRTLYAIIKGLMNLGWINKSEMPFPEGDDNKLLWHIISNHLKSDYLIFPEENFYSSHWNSELRKQTVKIILERLNKKNDIDLLLVAGTQAGQDLVVSNNPVNTFVFITSDPITSNIIKNINDHRFKTRVTVDSTRYYRQLSTFYHFSPFKNLGVIYENSFNGRTYASIDQIKKVAQEKGFNLIECHSLGESINEQEKREQSVLNCLNEFTNKVDALYITRQQGINSIIISKIVDWSIKNKIKTFTQRGSDEVKQGVLLGVTPTKFDIIGKFESEGIAKVLNGYPIKFLDQELNDPIFVSLNITTANKIGFIPSFIMMGIVEEIVR